MVIYCNQWILRENGWSVITHGCFRPRVADVADCFVAIFSESLSLFPWTGLPWSCQCQNRLYTNQRYDLGLILIMSYIPIFQNFLRNTQEAFEALCRRWKFVEFFNDNRFWKVWSEADSDIVKFFITVRIELFEWHDFFTHRHYWSRNSWTEPTFNTRTIPKHQDTSNAFTKSSVRLVYVDTLSGFGD